MNYTPISDETLAMLERAGVQAARIAAMRETRKNYLASQLRRFRPYIESTRFALTADDVRHDVESGRNRYA